MAKWKFNGPREGSSHQQTNSLKIGDDVVAVGDEFTAPKYLVEPLQGMFDIKEIDADKGSDSGSKDVTIEVPAAESSAKSHSPGDE